MPLDLWINVRQKKSLTSRLVFHVALDEQVQVGVNLRHLLARLDEVQEELLYYPPLSVLASAAAALAKCLSFYIKAFYVMGKVLSGELSCPCDRSCYIIY